MENNNGRNRGLTFAMVGLLVVVVMVLNLATATVVGGAAGYAVAQQVLKGQQQQQQQTGNPPEKEAKEAEAKGTENTEGPTTSIKVEVDSAVVDAVEKVQPAVVTVINTMPAREITNFWGESFETEPPVASGSGIIVDKDGYILTNNHVIEGHEKLEVIFNDGDKAEATLVGADPLADLAVIKVKGKVPAVAEIGDSDSLRPGETVIAIGSALGDFRDTVTVGVVSALNRRIDVTEGYALEGLIQTDAAINHGNSGGPLINLAGQVVGINTLVVRGNTFVSDQAEGLGFAIPSNTVNAIMGQLVENGYVTRPYMGISYEVITPRIASANNLDMEYGIYIRDVEEGGPSEIGGLEKGDIIIGINGQALDEEHLFVNELLKYKPGDKITLDVLRGEKELTVKVELSERPHENG